MGSFLLKLTISQDEKMFEKYAVVKVNLLYAFNEKKKKSLSCLHGDRDLLNLRC